MLRWLFIIVAIISASIAGVVEVATRASAQVAPSPLIVVATVPPQPTPLPTLRLPREEFAEQAIADASRSADQVPGSPATAQASVLASYGVVTISYDEQHHENSAALIATPHGVVLAHEGQIIDGVRVIGITQKGVAFDGGVFIPVGYSQQGSNPVVPPIGGALPAQQVPVSVTALPSSAPVPAAVPPHPTGPEAITQVNALQHLPTPAPAAQASPQTVQMINPFATPTPTP